MTNPTLVGNSRNSTDYEPSACIAANDSRKYRINIVILEGGLKSFANWQSMYSLLMATIIKQWRQLVIYVAQSVYRRGLSNSSWSPLDYDRDAALSRRQAGAIWGPDPFGNKTNSRRSR